jgi:hypothetical protein
MEATSSTTTVSSGGLGANANALETVYRNLCSQENSSLGLEIIAVVVERFDNESREQLVCL